MKQLLFLLLFPCLALAQYQGNAGQKITLGEQTTADGLVWRGRLADTANLLTNKLDTSVYIVLDTATRAMWYYSASTTPKWTRLVDSLNNLQGTLSVVKGGTGSTTQNFVDLSTNQTVNGLKTFGNIATFNDSIKVQGIKIGRGNVNSEDNLSIGVRALTKNTTSGGGNNGLYNVAIGVNVLRETTTGNQNTAIGYNALRDNNTGSLNVALGVNAARFNTTGSNNFGLGTAALDQNTTGSGNVAIGRDAVRSNTTSNYNVGIGQGALDVSTGATNTAIGYLAGYGTGTNANTTGSNNTFIGNESVGESSTESNRTWIGNTSTVSTWVGGNLLVGTRTNGTARLQVKGSTNALEFALKVDDSNNLNLLSVKNNGDVTLKNPLSVANGGTNVSSLTSSGVLYASSSSQVATSSNLTFNGSTALSIQNIRIWKGRSNQDVSMAIGFQALDSMISPGEQNMAVGYQSQFLNTTGSYNNSYGFQTLYFNKTGSSNNAFGYRSLFVTTGERNSGLGAQSLYSNTSGGYNVGIGYDAGYLNTTGELNTFIGYRAGQPTNGNTTGNNNIFIGNQSVGESATESNRTWIGNTSTVSTWVGGNLLVGTRTNGTARLQVKSSGVDGNTTALKVDNNGNVNLLTILDNGNVGVGVTNPLYKFEIESNITGASTLRLNNNNTGGALILTKGSTQIMFNGSADSWVGTGTTNDAGLGAYSGGIRFFTNNSTATRLTISTTGLVGIGRTPTTNILEINGDASKTTAGQWLANSDSTIKTEIHTIDGALDRINKIRLVSFKYKNEYKLLNPSIKDKFYQNVIAQEFQKIYPDYVYQSGTIFEGKNILQVDTNPMYIDAIASIQQLSLLAQELQSQIDTLKQEIINLKNK